jgi:hypothetical protein
MSNSPWILVSDKPVPEDRDVMLYLEKAHLGSRYAISKSQEISGGDYMRTVDGLFDFDLGIEALAWRPMDDFDDELPIELTGGQKKPAKKKRVRLSDQVGISFEKALDLVHRYGGIVRPFEKDADGNDISYGVTSPDNLVVPIPGSNAWDSYKKRFFHDLLIEQDEKEGEDK